MLAFTFQAPAAARRVVEAPRAPRSARADSEELIEISGAYVAIEDTASPYSAEIDPVSYSLDLAVDGVLISMSAFAPGRFEEAQVATRELARFQARCLRLGARCATTPFPNLYLDPTAIHGILSRQENPRIISDQSALISFAHC